MNITINGKVETLEENTTILDFIKLKGLNPENVAVEYNLNIVKNEEWSKTILKENDNLEVLSFVGGG